MITVFGIQLDVLISGQPIYGVEQMVVQSSIVSERTHHMSNFIYGIYLQTLPVIYTNCNCMDGVEIWIDHSLFFLQDTCIAY